VVVVVISVRTILRLEVMRKPGLIDDVADDGGDAVTLAGVRVDTDLGPGGGNAVPRPQGARALMVMRPPSDKCRRPRGDRLGSQQERACASATRSPHGSCRNISTRDWSRTDTMDPFEICPFRARLETWPFREAPADRADLLGPDLGHCRDKD
jgi:hypothetical protein